MTSLERPRQAPIKMEKVAGLGIRIQGMTLKQLRADEVKIMRKDEETTQSSASVARFKTAAAAEEQLWFRYLTQTCKDEGDLAGQLGLLCVPGAQSVSNTHTSGHRETHWKLWKRNENSHKRH